MVVIIMIPYYHQLKKLANRRRIAKNFSRSCVEVANYMDESDDLSVM